MSTIGRTFRILLSSTFSDFVAEREALHDRVWPEIRAYCHARGARFHLIDLRWGISEEASQDQRTVAVCLEEIRRCQAISPEFSFMALLGDRSGTRLLPVAIPAPDFELMLGAWNPAERAIVHDWYRRDENAMPAGAYVLLPRGGPGAVADGRYASFVVWEPLQRYLLDLLTRACQLNEVSAQTRFNILASVTEQEIQAGIVDAPDRGVGALCFRRIITGSVGNQPVQPRFQPLDRRSVGSAARRAKLEERLAGLPSGLIRYTVRDDDPDARRSDLDTFCSLVHAHVRAKIDDVLARDQDGGSQAARTSHDLFARDRLRHFAGREDILTAIGDYLRAPAHAPLLVTGPAGVGKTALLLKALAAVVPASESPRALSPVLLHRFIGGSADMHQLPTLLYDVCGALARSYGKADPIARGALHELIAQLPSFLALATAERPLILFIDAVDQLSDTPYGLDWLPTNLPLHVHLVVSSIRNGTVDAWRDAHPQAPTIDVPALDRAAMAETLTALLADDARTLQPAQYDQVLARSVASGLPLYLRLAAEAVRDWRSWQVGADLPDLPKDTLSLIQQRFALLESPAAHGHVLVQHAMGFLRAAKDGLAEDELIDLLSQDAVARDAMILRSPFAPQTTRVPVVLWSRLYFDLEAMLTEREQDGARLIGFYHQQVGQVARERYLTGDAGLACHRGIATYFEAQPVRGPLGLPNLRKLGEQAFQEASADETAALTKTLTDGAYLEAELGRTGVAGVLEDLALDLSNFTIEAIAHAVRVGAVVLGKAPEEIWNQARGRPGVELLLTASGERAAPRFDLRFASLAPVDRALSRILEGHARSARSCAFSPDGQLAVSASSDKTLRLWDIASGATLRVLEGHTSYVFGCAFSPDGRQVLSASHDRTVRLWDVATGSTVRVLTGHTGEVLSCEFSPNQQLVLSASADKTLRLWDLGSGSTTHVLEGHTGAVPHCAFSSDGKRMLSASSDRTLRVWDVASGATLRVLEGHDGTVFGCAFSPDGQLAVSASSDKTLRLWDVASGATLRVLEGHTSYVFGCAFSPDGRQVLSASHDRTVRLWDVATHVAPRVFQGHTATVWGCTFNRTHRVALSPSSDRTVRVWDMAAEVAERAVERHSGGVLSCAFSRDGRLALSASYDTTLRVWDVARGTTLQVLQGHDAAVWGCALSPDGQLALSASADRTLRVWDIASGNTLHVLAGHAYPVTGCAFSPDGRQALSSSLDRSLRVWDVASGAALQVLEPHTPQLLGCAYSPDGQLALSVSGDDHTVIIWDLRAGKILRILDGHARSVSSGVFSPNGEMALSASNDRTLRLWDVQDGTTLRVFSGHTAAVLSCAFSPDGNLVLSASDDATLRLWDTESARELTRWTTDDGVLSCAFSPTGDAVVAGDNAGGFHTFSLVTSHAGGSNRSLQ